LIVVVVAVSWDKMEVKFKIPNILESAIGFIDRIDIWHLVLFGAIIRFFVMPFPNDGGMIFDEVHYIKATRAMLEGLGANSEHPPLVKIIGVVAIKLFGDHWFAWRFPIVMFSVWLPLLVYKLSLRLFNDKRKAIFSALFSMFDIILFIHGNIYMLEIPAMVFSLLFVLWYLEKKPAKASLAISLGFLCNEKALWVLLGVAIYHILENFKLKNLIIDAKPVAVFLSLCVLFGGGGLFISDLIWRPSSQANLSVQVIETVYQNQTGPFTTSTATTTSTSLKYIYDPFSHVWHMFTYFTGISTGIPQIETTWRPPWSWVGPFGPNWSNPPTYLTTVVSFGDKKDYIINYRAQSTYPIWWMTLPILGLALLKRKETESKFFLGTLAGTYISWVAWELPRRYIPFNHYMMFAIPFLCLGIPWFWSKTLPKYQNQIMMVQLLLTIAMFIYFFPIGLVRTF